MSEKKMAEGFGLMFRPESWTSLEAFSTMLGPPYEITRGLQKGIISVQHHLQKFDVLGTLANRLREDLAEDQKELEEHGRTPALRSKEFSALIETLFCELYSTLDGVRTTLHAIYHKVRGVQKKSTEKMFKAAQDNAYGPEFPEPILKAMQGAYSTWFPRLRVIRTEVTHSEIGSCHLDPKTGMINYMHSGLGGPTRALVIDDIISELNEKAVGVRAFVEEVFKYLRTRLEPVERTVFCGIYKARMYQRNVAYTPDMTSNSGTCISLHMFQKDPELLCPLSGQCGAYKCAIEQQENG